jgi:hypothetical protein
MNPNILQGGTAPRSANAAARGQRFVGAGVGQASTSDKFDPWAFYGGNVAAACLATNDAVVEPQRTEGTGEDEEKKRLRANSRLTAWQSREKKRIEVEFLQERQAELKGRNEDLQKENSQLEHVIDRLKAAKQLGVSAHQLVVPQHTATSALRLPPMNQNASSAALNPSTATSSAANLARIQHTENLLFSYLGFAAQRDLPRLLSSSRSPDPCFLLFPQQQQDNRLPFHGGFLDSNGVVAPTVFAPLQRQSMQQQQQQQPPCSGLPFNLSLMAPQARQVDVPLYRTVPKKSNKRKGNASDDEASSTRKQARKAVQAPAFPVSSSTNSR